MFSFVFSLVFFRDIASKGVIGHIKRQPDFGPVLYLHAGEKWGAERDVIATELLPQLLFIVSW